MLGGRIGIGATLVALCVIAPSLLRAQPRRVDYGAMRAPSTNDLSIEGPFSRYNQTGIHRSHGDDPVAAPFSLDDRFVSATTLQAPPQARALFDKALARLASKKPNLPKAARLLERAVDQHSDFAASWALLGEIYMRDSSLGEASAALERAVEADPKYPLPYKPLISLALQAGEWRKAEGLAEGLARLDPTDQSAAYLRALAIYGDSRLEEAAALLDSALAAPKAQIDTRLHLLRAWVWADQGNTIEASTSLEAYLASLEIESPHRVPAEALLQRWKTSPDGRKSRE